MKPHTIFLEQQMKNSEHLVSFSGVNNTLMGFNILIHVLTTLSMSMVSNSTSYAHFDIYFHI